MGYGFGNAIDRRGTDSMKHDFAEERGMAGAIPLWVADMDFMAPNETVEAVVKCAAHGVYGYTEPKEGYARAVCNWFTKRHGFGARPEWLVKTPGVVFALAMCVRAFTDEGGAVLIQRPVYRPFASVVENNGRKLINSPLVLDNGRYSIDFDDFEKKIAQNNVKLFIMCSPHNPVGRAWEPGELKTMGDVCARHGAAVVSDEIHCDFVYGGHRHTVFGSIGEAYLQNSVICTSPSKTFNLAGLQTSNVFIANGKLRAAFQNEIGKTGYGQQNMMGLAACRAAYEHGGGWLDALIGYLGGSLSYMRESIAERMPEIKLIEPDGTYLAWLDFRKLGVAQDDLERLLAGAGLWLSGGTAFGPEGHGFMRLNYACPRSVIEEAMPRLWRAVKGMARR